VCTRVCMRERVNERERERERGRESAPRVAAKQQRSARHDDCSANLVTEEGPRRLRRTVERATTPRALRDSLLLRGMRGIIERSFLRPARAYEQIRSISMAYGDDPPPPSPRLHAGVSLSLETHSGGNSLLRVRKLVALRALSATHSPIFIV